MESAGSPKAETPSSRFGRESDSDAFSLTRLLGSWSITAPQFLQIWNHYDDDGERVRLSNLITYKMYGTRDRTDA